MLDLVSTVEGLNSTVMTAMTVMTPSPITSDEQTSTDKIKILQTEIAKLTKTVHDLKTLQEETKQVEQSNQFREQDFGVGDSENVLDLSLIDDAFFTTTTTASTTTTTDFPITTFNWFTSTPSTKRPTSTKKSSKFVPSAEGEGFLEITVSGAMGPGNKKLPGLLISIC